jgi:hypothetical protein
MPLKFPDDAQRAKENALWWGRLTVEEKLAEYVSLLDLMEQSVEANPSARARQLAWIDRDRDAVQAAIRALRDSIHDRQAP